MSIEELKANIAEKERNLAAMEEDDESYAAAKAEVDALKQELAKAEKGDDTNNTSDKKDDIEAIVEERLAKMKANMDRMAKERDEAFKLKAEMEKSKKDADIARMKEEGKIQEALEMELAEAKAKLSLYEQDITSLRRDSVVNDALAGLEFRNEKSREMARREIVDDLIQNDQGQWVHKTGSSIKDFIESYAKNEDNSFLFRIKANTGAGTNTSAGVPNTTPKKSILEMSTTEVLDLAKKGQLGNFKY
jgi:hypothetical protein